MSKVYWFCKLALGLTVFIACLIFSIYLVLEYKQGHTNQRDTAAEYHSNATQHSPASCGAVMGESGFIGWLTCLADNVSADGGVKQAEYDLNAQQDMAAWALGMLIATIWMAIITLFGVFFVWRTLKATRETVAATKEIGRDQSRAYVHADRVDFFWGGERQERPRVEVWVRNTGLTPAKWYEIRIKELVYPHEGSDVDTPIIDQVSFPESFQGPWNAIPADSQGNKATFFFTADEGEEINKSSQDRLGLTVPSHGFSIIGEIRYQTVFGEIYISQFAFGRGMIPAYRVDKMETRVVDDVTINDSTEKPVILARYAANLDTYKKIEG